MSERDWLLALRNKPSFGMSEEYANGYFDALKEVDSAIATAPPAQDARAMDDLIEFFRNEGHRLGWQGDQYGWTPEQTAIKAMRELLRLHPMAALPQGDTKPHHAPPSPIDPAAVLALADEMVLAQQQAREIGVQVPRTLVRIFANKLRSLATGGKV